MFGLLTYDFSVPCFQSSDFSPEGPPFLSHLLWHLPFKFPSRFYKLGAFAYLKEGTEDY